MAEAGSGTGAAAEVARAHHGSVSRQERTQIEEALKAGRLPAVVATSSLELGIDMGAVDLVIQVESPPSVASGLQRTGRAGHNVGDVSRGVIFPKYQGDLVQATVVAQRMRGGQIEELRMPRNPLDVLAQQIVAMTAMDDWDVTELEQTVRRAAPFSGLTRPVLEAVLDMLAGRYPSDEFAGLRPRLVWDRTTGTLRGRPGGQRMAVTNGGTIPDRGLFGVFLAGGQRDKSGRHSRRVGELDEEMVYESRVGDVFVLGASSWRIEDITADQVLVTPAPGQPGKLPFWHGDAPGRPAELGAAIGAYCRELGAASPQDATARLHADGLDDLAASNLVSYLTGQREATGYVPDDRTLVMERFRDELGDWRLILHSPYGAKVHAPWALAIAARLRERYGGMNVQAMHTDDGIVIRVPDADDPPPAGIAVLDPDEVEQLVTTELGASALFASRFRECAARALLLPRRQPGRRTPLWQQRQRSAQLLAVASQYGTFPIVLETVRECLQDVFDVPGLTSLMRDLAARSVRLVEVETPAASPFGRSLLFRYVGAFMYEGDAPLAERRAQALALDSALLAELLGQADMRELLDPLIVADAERELQRLAPSRTCTSAEGLADLIREIGPLSAAEVTERCADHEAAPLWLAALAAQRRVIEVRVAAEPRWAAIEDAGRLRDALGTPLPLGIPDAFTEPVRDPLSDLIARYARTRGPFTAAAAAQRYGLGVAVVAGTLRRLAAEGRIAEGEFLPGGRGTEWCDAGVLRLLRRRCLAKLRKEAEPVPPKALGAFLPAWQHAGQRARQGPGPARPPGQEHRAGRCLRRGRAAGGRGRSRLGTGEPGAAGPPARLLARAAGRADRRRRGRLVGRGRASRQRRLGRARTGGRGALAVPRAWRDHDDTRSRRDTRRAGRRRRAVLPRAGRPRSRVAQRQPGQRGDGRLRPRGRVLYHSRTAGAAPGRTRRGPGRRERDLGSGLGRAADQRHPGSAADGTRHGSSGVRSAAFGAAPDAVGQPVNGRDITGSDITGRGITGRGSGGGGLRAAGRSGGRAGPHRPGFGRGIVPSRGGPPTVSGRWSLLPPPETDQTRRMHALALTLLDRHGIVIRGAAMAERVPGGFSALYPVLRAMEETGQCRRGYFVEGLGAAQFALPGAVDRMRAMAETVSASREPAAGRPWPRPCCPDGRPASRWPTGPDRPARRSWTGSSRRPGAGPGGRTRRRGSGERLRRCPAMAAAT